ncbi:MAG TPA: hypothetical protein VEK38_02560 [Candidatus Bathyarchaeia archaeon]|nr:hypothetical protein [Candidatus Bathyarchaeia archaeon]
MRTRSFLRFFILFSLITTTTLFSRLPESLQKFFESREQSSE